MTTTLTPDDVILLSAAGAAWVLAGLALLAVMAAVVYAAVHRVCVWCEQLLAAVARRRDLKTCRSISSLPVGDAERGAR